MRKYYYFAIFSLITVIVNAQNNFLNNKIQGFVFNESSSPIELANVTLHRSADSSLVKANTTNNKGFFEFSNLAEGNYFIRISHTNYQSYRSSLFQLNLPNREFALPNIQLKNKSNNLKDIVVQSSKPLIERKTDRFILNVENSIINTGGTANEVLEYAPGVSIDPNGQISLNGKPNVLIMVDGRIVGDNVVKTLSAANIDKIEIITNPSARYDAAGSGGIINIRLKKDQKLGMNGTATISYGQGVYAKTNNSLGLNYRNKKWNFYGNYTFSFRKEYQNIYNPRRLLKNGKLFNIYDQYNYITKPTQTHTIRAGIDYFVNKSTTIGIIIDGNVSRFNKTGDNQTSILDSMQNPAGRFTTHTSSNDHWNSGSININAKHIFNDKGKEINIDLNGASYKTNTDQNFTTHYYDVMNNLTKIDTLIGPFKGYINLFSLKIDYSHPINKNAKIEVGTKNSFTKTDNDVEFFNIKNNVAAIDTNTSNHFKYNENINAFYIIYNQKFKKWSMELGLRGEQTTTNGNQLNNGETFHHSYFQLFPNLSINHKIGKKHELNYSVSRRINRPSYQQLNPFKVFYDPSTYDEGNPFLLPELSYALEISDTYKELIRTSIEYTHTNNVISYVVLQDVKDPKISILQIKNIEKYNHYGLSLNTPLKIKKWWTINNNLGINYNSYKGSLVNTGLQTEGFSFRNNMIHTIVLPKNWSTELNFIYRSTDIHPLGLYQAIYVLSLGVQKTIMQRKGTLRFNIRDLFHSNRIFANTKFANVDEKWQQYTDSRVATVSFTYRFGKKTVTAARKRETGLETEKDRIQIGGQ